MAYRIKYKFQIDLLAGSDCTCFQACMYVEMIIS